MRDITTNDVDIDTVTPTNGQTTPEDGKHLWSTLLRDVTEKASVKLSSRKSLIVLGNDESGKTTLLARLQGTEDPKKSFGLEYAFIEVKDEDRDDQTKLSVWILDGDTAHTHLLKFAINAKNVADSMVVIVVSMAEPWNIPDNLEKWAGILEQHIKRLNIPLEEMTELKESLVRHFREYVEPDSALLPATDSSSLPTPAPIPVPATPTVVPLAMRRSINPLHPATAALLSSTLNAPPSGASTITDAKDADSLEETTLSEAEKLSAAAAGAAALAAAELPISPNTLTNNLGIPLLVVVTKTDAIGTLEKEYQYNDEHFDFIQMHIRRFCLAYGAALFYVSVKEDKNCDLLNRYIQHRVYGFPFTQTAYVVERDSIFVPTGWDNEKKINILEENLAKLRPDNAYNEVIQRPSPRKAVLREPEQQAQDEQSFLARLMANMQRENTMASAAGQGLSPGTNTASPATADPMYDQFQAVNNGSPSVGSTPGGGSPLMTTGSGPGGRPSASPRTPVSGFRGKPTTAQVSGGAGGSAGPGPGSSEGVLANFFNSLLSKRSPMAGVSSPSHAAGPAGQSAANGNNPERISLSQKDMHSELERLARSSREALEAGTLQKAITPPPLQQQQSQPSENKSTESASGDT